MKQKQVDFFDLGKCISKQAHRHIAQHLLTATANDPGLCVGISAAHRTHTAVKELLQAAQCTIEEKGGLSIVQVWIDQVERDLFYQPARLLGLKASVPHFEFTEEEGAEVPSSRCVCIGDDGRMGIELSLSLGEYNDNEADASAYLVFIIGAPKARAAALAARIAQAMKSATRTPLAVLNSIPEVHRARFAAELHRAIDADLATA